MTRLLEAAAGGDRRAAADLLPLVYDELRRLAAARMAAEAPGHTLQPTALVHEAYLRLIGRGDDRRWDGHGHFFAAAAEAMRRILIESARRRRGPERGGDVARRDLDPDQPAAAALPTACSPSTRPSTGSRPSSPGPRRWSSSATSPA
ncbi:MAG: ECF-type sigma factor [Isosphaeraceae bacterium]